MRTALPRWLALALLALGVVLALAPAGTVIENQASATVASDERYLSNVVRTVVQPVCVPDLSPDGTPSAPGQSASVAAGGYASFPYVLSNQGNAEFDFQLSWVEAETSDWHPASAQLFLDINGNGEADLGEPEINHLNLAAGETARLVLRVKAPSGPQGDLLISPLARCPSGEEDGENFARVRLRAGPALAVEKRFDPPEVAPGEVTQVELKVRNLGDADARGEVILSDDLSSLAGLTYVPGSASAPKGQIEFYDGQAWSAFEPGAVKAIRLRLLDLAVGEEAPLHFGLRAALDRAPGAVENVARAEGPGRPAEARAFLRVRAVYWHHLGPKGNPRALPGGEGSSDDRQSAYLFEGQRTCFAHTLENAGNAEDSYHLSVGGVPSGFQATLVQTGGAPLPNPITLPAGATYDFLFCLKAPLGSAGSRFAATLEATSRATGAVNRTVDEVTEVLPAGGLKLEKSADKSPVAAGETLSYTLKIKNTYSVDLHDAEVADALDPLLEYLSSTPAGNYDPDRRQVTWRIGTLPAGGTWQATLRVRVHSDAPDDARISNRFTLTAREFTDPVTSPTVEVPVWSTQILIQKKVDSLQVRVGERVTYTLTLKNPSQVAVVLDLTDRPDPHLRYIPGSAKPREPEVNGNRLVWKGVRLATGETKAFRYSMRVLPGVPERIENRAVARGESAGGTAVATGWVMARLKVVDPAMHRRRGTLVGRVFLDFNRDGRYDEGHDFPLPGARLVLADGRQALTDVEGRYAFRDLAPGPWLLRLDPASAPFPLLSHPAALDGGCTHRVLVYGLTVSDFPLTPPTGWVRGYRSTVLRMGPLTLEKRLLPLGDGRYRVVLHLTTKAPLPEFELRDPLPGGGERRFFFDLLEGEKTITYDLEAPAWLTDPEVRWRYP